MVTPILRIFDYQKALEFYIGWLGFSIDWEEQKVKGGPQYMQVSRGDIVLHLSGHHGDSCPGAKVMAEVNGLLAYHHFLLQKDYPFMRPNLEKTIWSDKVMQAVVTDPFGNSLVFVEACA
ncbi:MAG: glyoxalase/bleomycin resistance/extradiol dioxygenase family protein [Hymenobacter sp.]|jgi:hypothetical protein|nr:glyoxalase/bleomycin resistance/extradiol dioxygenase family protein [Hymenobacter sp.]